MDTFLTVHNFQVVHDILRKFMQDRYGFDLATSSEDGLRKTMYQVMVDLQKAGGLSSLKDANNRTLNLMRDILVRRHALAELPDKSLLRTLDRERSVYGHRPVSTAQIKPEDVSVKSGSAEADQTIKLFDNVVKLRQDEHRQEAPLAEVPGTNQRLDEALPASEFSKRMVDIERLRDEQFGSSVQIQSVRPAVPDDPAALYRSAMPGTEEKKDPLPGGKPAPAQPPLYINYAQEGIIPHQKHHQSLDVCKYIAVNGFDRDWVQNPYRFAFSVPALANRYRNITRIKFTTLLIPTDILDVRSASNIPKPYFLNNFHFNFPYLLLQVKELDSLYDGTNPSILRSQTMFSYCSDYRASNGRGYLMLKPIQDEEIVFYPNSLASLPKMTMSLLKPNGVLFNDSKDTHTIAMVVYEDYNAEYLKIVLSRYFDKNEFFKGDTVLMQGYRLDPAPSVGQSSDMERFLNRAEGHEIIELGQANDNGYYLNFSIRAPGGFNDRVGAFELDTRAIVALNAYNEAAASCTNPVTSHGSILNMSLQATLTMRIHLSSADAGGLVQSQSI